MRQEVGETSKAIVEDDERTIEKILAENKDRRELYWIVLFAKPAKGFTVDGMPTLIKVIKAYYTKPRQNVGMVVGEVNNVTGNIKWEVNLPDKPFGFEVIGLQQDGIQTYETTIPQSYAYN